jgi:drug/metabolite transporter (DMT)-like permease
MMASGVYSREPSIFIKPIKRYNQHNPMAYLAIVAAQLMYSISDTLKKWVLRDDGFSVQAMLKPLFLVALLIAFFGFLFQMYSLARIDLSRNIIILGMLAVVFSTIAGVVVFKDQLNGWNVAGIVLALVAIVLVNIK